MPRVITTLTCQVVHIKTTTLATWNEQILYQCGKLEKAMKEIIKYKIDILGLCEMRWACSKSVKEDKTTGVCTRHLIKCYINIKDHILGIGTC